MTQQPLPLPSDKRHGLVELLARYRLAFSTAWARRDELVGPRRLSNERAFLPATMELEESPPHPAPRRIIILVCSLFIATLIWAVVGQIEIVAIANGRAIITQGSKTIQPLEPAVVKAIHVKDGDLVHAGQLLVELDTTNTRAEAKQLADAQKSAEADLIRLRTLIASYANEQEPEFVGGEKMDPDERSKATKRLRSDWFDIRTRLARFEAERARRLAETLTAEQVIAKIETILPFTQRRELDLRALIDQGFISRHVGQDKTRDRLELEQDLATARARLRELQAALRENEIAKTSFLAQTEKDLREKLEQAELKGKQLHEEGVKIGQRMSLAHLVSPVAGSVQQLAVHTTGGVVTPAQVLMTIVPSDSKVMAEVALENKDIGFIQPGQAAEIKLETFPFTRYGTIRARVNSLSADAIRDEKGIANYQALVDIGEGIIMIDGKRMSVSPGMNLTAEIKTGKRRVIDYFIKPIETKSSSSFKER